MKALRKVYDVFTAVEKYFLACIFLFATVMVVVNVFGRKLFGFSLNWLEELNRYILVICTFIGSAIAVTMDMHPKMDSVVGLFKGRARLVIAAFASLVFTLFMAVMTYYAFSQLGIMLKTKAMTATLGLPVYVFFTFIPLGFCGMAVRSAVKFVLSVGDIISYGKPGRMQAPEGGAEP